MKGLISRARDLTLKQWLVFLIAPSIAICLIFAAIAVVGYVTSEPGDWERQYEKKFEKIRTGDYLR